MHSRTSYTNNNLEGDIYRHVYFIIIVIARFIVSYRECNDLLSLCETTNDLCLQNIACVVDV